MAMVPVNVVCVVWMVSVLTTASNPAIVCLASLALVLNVFAIVAQVAH